MACTFITEITVTPVHDRQCGTDTRRCTRLLEARSQDWCGAFDVRIDRGDLGFPMRHLDCVEAEKEARGDG